MSKIPADINTFSSATPSRRLTEDVLQSAEDAVLTNPDAFHTLQRGPAMLDGTTADTIGLTYSQKLERCVHARPVQSALLALAAGAFLAALIKSAVQRRLQ